MRPEVRELNEQRQGTVAAVSPYVFQAPTVQHPSFDFAMGEISGGLKGLREDLSLLRSDSKEVEGRVDKLERRIWFEAGAVSIAAFVGTDVIQWVIYHGFVLK